MSNLIDIQGQIDKLQKQASEIRTREFDSTVQEIVAKMQAFGITTRDLDLGKRRSAKGKGKVKGKVAVPGKRAASTVKKASSPVPAKFRGPQGETWTGRGLMPRWLAALVAQGQLKEDFAIKD